MPLVADRALCLRRIEYSETSQVLWLFTRGHGLMKVVAKGAHRVGKLGQSKFDGGVDLLHEADALVTDHTEKELNSLAEWKIRQGRRGYRQSLRAIHLGMHLAELVTQLFELHDPHQRLYDRMSLALTALEDPLQREAEGLACVIDILREAGIMPRIAYCAICNRQVLGQRLVTVSARHGGVLCDACDASLTERIRLEGGLLQLAAALYRADRDASPGPLPELERTQTDPLHAMMIRHVQQTIGRRLHTGRYVAGFEV